jgi:hypothetical protein
MKALSAAWKPAFAEYWGQISACDGKREVLQAFDRCPVGVHMPQRSVES